ncbi:MAG: coiled-coil domain-containing protein [Candidatus Saccharimonadaceae bacterium]
MKLRSTTPVSISQKAKKAFLIFTALVIVGSGAGYLQPQSVSADQYDDKIRALQADMDRYQTEANRLNSEATTLANALAQITNEKNAILAQIDVSQAQYDQLIIQIAQTEKQIKDNQDALGTTIADMYLDDDISPIEMLASSQNISQFLDKQEYRNAVKDELGSTIKKVKDLKLQLTTQKAEVETVLATQKTARDSLVAKEAEQSRLVAQTRNDEAAYQGLIQSSAAQIAQARATQAALSSKTVSTGGFNLLSSGLLPGYVTDNDYGTWNSSSCPMSGYLSTRGVGYAFGGHPAYDGQDGRGYGCRQCASYVAWKINQEKGFYPSWGNARDFGSKGSSTSPKAGTVAVLYDGGPGHVAWVETDPYISNTGKLKGKSVIQVSQYNFNYGQGYGMYSLMELSVGFFDTYRQL